MSTSTFTPSLSCPENPPLAHIKTTFGSLAIGIWLQQLFLGYVLAQMVDYYRFHFATDRMFNKIIVTALLVLNLFIGGIDFHVLYRSTVLFYGDFEHFDLQEWTMWTEPAWSALVSFLAQLFFIARCQRFVKSYCITAFLLLLALLSFSSSLGAMTVALRVRRFSSLVAGSQLKLLVVLRLISTATADVCIAGVLTGQLLRSKSSSYHRTTNTVLTRLIIASMETSAITAFVALFILVLFFLRAYYLLPHFSLCRLYTLTVMGTLLSRIDNRTLLIEARAGMPSALTLQVSPAAVAEDE